MKIAVRSLHGDLYAIAPSGFLGEEAFRRYQRAVGASFAEYDPDAQAYRCKLVSLPQILDRLTADGFLPVANQDVRDAVTKAREKRNKARGEAKSRSTKVNEELKARGLALYPYQFEGVDFLASRNEALLADQMGLGKTVQSLLAIPRDARVLIVCPKAVKGVWASEIDRFRPDYRWGMAGQDVVLPQKGEALITGYHLLPDPVERQQGDFVQHVWAGEPLPPDMVVIADEAHAVKNSKSKRTMAFRALVSEVRRRGGKVWLLTATPLLGRPQDLWGVLSSGGLSKGAFGSWDNFLAHYHAKKTPWGKGYFWGKPGPEVQKAVDRVSLRRLRRDVLPELPTKTYKDFPVVVDSMALRKELDTVRWEDPKELPPFDMLAKVRAMLAQHKIDAMLEVVSEYEAQEEPLVVFSAHRAPIEALRKNHPVITGDESAEERSKIVNEFQAGWSVRYGKHFILGATIAAGGVGITLTRSAHALFVDRDWTPALNEQAEDRICRIGQDRGCVITTLVADHPIDRHMEKILARKRDLIERSVRS